MRWQATFEARVGQHARLRAVEVPRLDACVARHLRRSLAVFQLGESGDGTHLLEAASLSMATDEYVGALKRFVAEEQEHARMLAVVLDALDGPMLSHHWSDRLFVLARRTRSLVTEVLVLLVAEVVALSYYSTLRDGLPAGELRETFARIHDDEFVHVDFHCDTLPRHLDRFSARTRSVVRFGWNTLVAGAAIGVAISHGPALRALGTTRRHRPTRPTRPGRGRTAAVRLTDAPPRRRVEDTHNNGPLRLKATLDPLSHVCSS